MENATPACSMGENKLSIWGTGKTGKWLKAFIHISWVESIENWIFYLCYKHTDIKTVHTLI